jgi:hypothetical protein
MNSVPTMAMIRPPMMFMVVFLCKPNGGSVGCWLVTEIAVRR